MPKRPTEIRPITWSRWLRWVVVWALVSGLSAVNDDFSSFLLWAGTAPREGVQTWPIWLILTLSLFACVRFLEWTAIRTTFPGVTYAAWLGAVALSGVVSAFSAIKMGHLASGDASFSQALLVHRLDGALSLAEFWDLPWKDFLLLATVTVIAASLVPAVILARRDTAAFFAILCAVVVAQIGASLLPYILLDDSHRLAAPGQLTFTESDRHFAWSRSIIHAFWQMPWGAVWGALSATAFALLLRSGIGRLGVLPFAKLLTVTCAFLYAIPTTTFYLMGPNGLRHGLPELRRMLTVAPKQDLSHGERVLEFVRETDLRPSLQPGRWPVVHFSPDGRSFIAIDRDNRIQNIELATGKVLGSFSGPTLRYESYDAAWSPDGGYVALQTWVTGIRRMNISDTNSIRVFETKRFREIAHARLDQFGCSGKRANPAGLAFEGDGRTLWILCDRDDAEPRGNKLAMKLAVPSLEIVGDYAASVIANDKVTEGLFISDGHVHVVVTDRKRRTPRAVFNLTTGQQAFALPDLRTAGFAAEMTYQWPVDRSRQDRLDLPFCGFPSERIDQWSREKLIAAISRCRVFSFDTSTGRLADHWNTVRSAVFLNRVRADVDVRADYRPDTRVGELVVLDGSGQERQRISSVAQRPLNFSPDGHWLITHAIYDNNLRIYRVAND